ncbi:MAG TPA: hypothetical protein VFX85_10680 [Solirubrobacterales bacterium]|nr:hypothetical protein [Solirubrobacterales bacterium]
MTKPGASAVERRAIGARLSLCSAIFTMLLALGALVAPTASAIPARPALTETSPASPGASLRPRIKGRAEEIIISVVRLSAASRGPVGRAVDPNNTITIYKGDATCLDAGAVVGVGTAGELEGVGILIDEGVVTADSVTTFYATQTDATGTSSCSGGLTYRQVMSPPPTPTVDAVSPASPADENLPYVAGVADPESTVSIYSNATCSGAPLASGSGAEFGGVGIRVPVPDNSTTTFYAAASWGGFSSACSGSSVSYQEVTVPSSEPPGQDPGGQGPSSGGGGQGPADQRPAVDPPGRPPAPKLRTVPGGTANNNTPLVTGTAPNAARVEIFAGEDCKGTAVAKGSVSEFTSGLPVPVADNSTVSFYGIAIDGGGDRSTCSPSPAVYVEDSTLPRTRITMGPGLKTRKRTAVFRFLDSTGEAVGTTFLCRIDRRKWKPCMAPFRIKRLTRRAHVFQVKATDPAGNREQKPVKRRFKVIP